MPVGAILPGVSSARTPRRRHGGDSHRRACRRVTWAAVRPGTDARTPRRADRRARLVADQPGNDAPSRMRTGRPARASNWPVTGARPPPQTWRRNLSGQKFLTVSLRDVIPIRCNRPLNRSPASGNLRIAHSSAVMCICGIPARPSTAISASVSSVSSRFPVLVCVSPR